RSSGRGERRSATGNRSASAPPVDCRSTTQTRSLMPRFDLPPEELRTYRPAVSEPADFDAFWERTLAESRAVAQPPQLTRVASPLTAVEVYDMTFSGFAGDPVAGWLIV